MQQGLETACTNVSIFVHPSMQCHHRCLCAHVRVQQRTSWRNLEMHSGDVVLTTQALMRPSKNRACRCDYARTCHDMDCNEQLTGIPSDCSCRSQLLNERMHNILAALKIDRPGGTRVTLLWGRNSIVILAVFAVSICSVRSSLFQARRDSRLGD